METIGLARATDELRQRFGGHIEAAYVPGKTVFRDTLCDRLGLSELEAEELCDSLETAHLIRFERSALYGPRWAIGP